MSIPKIDDPKDPDDVTDFNLSFAEAMPEGDTILAIDQVTITPANLGDAPASNRSDVSVLAQLFTGQNAVLWLQDGKSSWRYLISVLLRTVGGRTLRRRAYLKVAEL